MLFSQKLNQNPTYFFNANTVEIVRQPEPSPTEGPLEVPVTLIVDGQHIPVAKLRGHEIDLCEADGEILIPVTIRASHLVRRVEQPGTSRCCDHCRMKGPQHDSITVPQPSSKSL